MYSGFPNHQKYTQLLEENSSPGFINTLFNDRYRILKSLGQGGFGKTFLAIDEKYQKPEPESRFCVIKQFCPQCCMVEDYQQAYELFCQESLRLAELGNHPQIPQLLETFEQDGNQHFVQEWVDGKTLQQELAETGAFGEVEIRQLLDNLLPVLQFVHAHQVIHRDIKPANIIRRQQDHQLFLVDFGAAKYNNEKLWQQTETIIGSAEYAAPEQVRGKAVFASDLYSLGVTCLHLLTQISPFDLYDCAEDIWIWRSYLVEPISLSLEKILCKLVQPATKLRYHFAAEVFMDLNSLPQYFISSSNGSINANNKDFKTHFLELSQEENLLNPIIPIADNSLASITVFDPQTQDWYYFPAKIKSAEVAGKVTTFLGLRLAIAVATPPVKQSKLLPVYRNNTYKLGKMHQMIFTVISLIVVSLVSLIKSNLIPTNFKVKISRIFQQLMYIEKNKKSPH